ncbi:hypothetical protein HAHE_16340 [Haloferula helveola]|uniref:Uncharacterized protein n=1 Tax=Haloferula helveola TaxID=490095 RepID=A0ABN6H290_9BACT|nr:hypothetical protein HAHE_16340 [Haloferula helveola]
MNTLAFKIEPCPVANDHQVRLIVDGHDWFEDDDTLGIDPPEFFAQGALISGGMITVGRCGCGAVGCDNIEFEVERKSPGVIWRVREGVSYVFRESDYDRLIEAASSDFSWEDANRTAERLVADVLAGTTIDDGFQFDWASARVGHGKITLSYSRAGEQRTFDFGWDGVTPESAIPGAKRFKQTRVDQGVGGQPATPPRVGD